MLDIVRLGFGNSGALDETIVETWRDTCLMILTIPTCGRESGLPTARDTFASSRG